jgi:type II secretory ATPase GspE/PulE/Tfp pilus assembly ATPase PilB-like protein
MSQIKPMIDVSDLEVTAAVNMIIEHAIRIKASDLFINSNEDFVAVQVRTLGLMRPLCIVSQDKGKHFLAHIKAMASMDISEFRRPLDGRWIHETDKGDVVDLRINMIPTMHGVDMALRLLARSTGLYSVDGLGLDEQEHRHCTNMLSSPSGMILCTGPTGSGKTTTLYACLQHLNNGQRKINTIEDPIEYSIEGLRQSQINPRIGVGFSDLLRSVLRQGPDIIMIGEIRDSETAQTAVRAANSGHLVLATLHAPIAAAAVDSLRALGVHPHFLSAALRGVISQRLVRTLCSECKISFDLSDAPHTFEDVRKWLGPDEGKVLFAPKGCKACNMQGYAARTGVFEVMQVQRDLRLMIARECSTNELRAQAIKDGMMELRHSALLKVARGETSTEEVFRVIPAEHLLKVDD